MRRTNVFQVSQSVHDMRNEHLGVGDGVDTCVHQHFADDGCAGPSLSCDSG